MMVSPMHRSNQTQQQQPQHCCHADGKLVDIDGLSTQCRGGCSNNHCIDNSIIYDKEENNFSSDEENIATLRRASNTTEPRKIVECGPYSFTGDAGTCSTKFIRNNSTSNKIGIAQKFCRPRPKSMDAEVLKNLQRNCHNLILEGKRDKNRSLSDNEDTSSTDDADTVEDEEESSPHTSKEKDIDRLMEEQRQISGSKQEY